MYFGNETVEDRNPIEHVSAVCLHCKQAVVMRNDNTTNLLSLLYTQHPTRHETEMKVKKAKHNQLL